MTIPLGGILLEDRGLLPTLYRPDVLFQDGQLRRGGELYVDGEGRVTPPRSVQRTVDLKGRLLLPGLVNAHSHAFQRVLRGRFEYVASGHAHDDFWSWRDGMYRAAQAMTPESVFHVSRQAFCEMVQAGITTVGEFHYLHHQADGTPYEDEHEIARHVIAAAHDVGLRLVLLRVGYQRAGFQMPENPLQRRFLSKDAGAFLAATERLQKSLAEDAFVTVGTAPHSVRAVDRAWLTEFSRAPKRLTHMHVAEQAREVEACLEEYGMRPFEYLSELGLLHEAFTAVHGIEVTPSEISLLARQKSHVCACPSTEKNLGDGIVPAEALMQAQVPVCLGSDSQAEIDLLNEARSLEGHLRLSRKRRGVLDDGTGEVDNLGRRLLSCATREGARSLQLDVGSLSVGQPADFFTLDLNHPSLLGVPDASLLPAVAMGAEKSAILEVAVQGQTLVTGGRHPRAEAISQGYQHTLKGLSF